MEQELYMELPKGFVLDFSGDPKAFVLHVRCNTYGQEQAR